MNIGTNIRTIRELKSLSQENMAEMLKISQSSYSRIESGFVIPKVDKLQKIANFLEVNISVLVDTPDVHHTFVNSLTNNSYNNQEIRFFDELKIREIVSDEIKRIV